MLKVARQIGTGRTDCLEDGVDKQQISYTYLTSTFAEGIFLGKTRTTIL